VWGPWPPRDRLNGPRGALFSIRARRRMFPKRPVLWLRGGFGWIVFFFFHGGPSCGPVRPGTCWRPGPPFIARGRFFWEKTGINALLFSFRLPPVPRRVSHPPSRAQLPPTPPPSQSVFFAMVVRWGAPPLWAGGGAPCPRRVEMARMRRGPPCPQQTRLHRWAGGGRPAPLVRNQGPHGPARIRVCFLGAGAGPCNWPLRPPTLAPSGACSKAPPVLRSSRAPLWRVRSSGPMPMAKHTEWSQEGGPRPPRKWGIGLQVILSGFPPRTSKNNKPGVPLFPPSDDRCRGCPKWDFRGFQTPVSPSVAGPPLAATGGTPKCAPVRFNVFWPPALPSRGSKSGPRGHASPRRTARVFFIRFILFFFSVWAVGAFLSPRRGVAARHFPETRVWSS